jgi:hypothetical protein
VDVTTSLCLVACQVEAIRRVAVGRLTMAVKTSVVSILPCVGPLTSTLSGGTLMVMLRVSLAEPLALIAVTVIVGGAHVDVG